MSSLILFDLDHTLFDTTVWVNEYVLPILSEALGVNTESLKAATDQYLNSLPKTTDFDPEEYVKWLQQEYEANPESLLQFIYTKSYFEHSLFADVLPALSVLSEVYSLGIFSEGVKSYQQKKIVYSGLEDWLDPEYMFIFPRKLEPAQLKNLPTAIVVDDRTDVAEALSVYSHLRPIWLNRRDLTQHPDLPTIHSLMELQTELKNIE